MTHGKIGTNAWRFTFGRLQGSGVRRVPLPIYRFELNLRDNPLFAPAPMVVNCPNVPREAIGALAGQLRKFGCVVTFEGENGTIRHESGTLSFSHYPDGTLAVTILHNPGHFPQRLIAGGIRQLVEETMEAMLYSKRGVEQHGSSLGS